jgi:sugar fermentation stimulation protein A
MKFQTPLIHATLIKRYRRSLVDARLGDGTVITAHCPNATTMRGCYKPGNPVILSDSGNPGRRHRHTWELINMDGTWVCVNPMMARKVIYGAIEKGMIPSLSDYKEIDHETTYGTGNKIDMILHSMERNCLINIYPVTWAENDIALYPDFVSERITKSLLGLIEVVKQEHSAMAFFFVQRGDCSRFKPAENIDRAFLKAMLAAESKGVEIMVYRADVTTEEISLGIPIPYSLA